MDERGRPVHTLPGDMAESEAMGRRRHRVKRAATRRAARRLAGSRRMTDEPDTAVCGQEDRYPL